MFYSEASPTPQQIVSVVLNECKKNDKGYKRHAVLCLSSLLKSFSGHVDLFEQVKEALINLATGIIKQVMHAYLLNESVGNQEDEKTMGSNEGEMKDQPLTLLIKYVLLEKIS